MGESRNDVGTCSGYAVWCVYVLVSVCLSVKLVRGGREVVESRKAEVTWVPWFLGYVVVVP